MKSNLCHILALNIKKRRYILGFSQAKLAEKADIAVAYVGMIETGKKFPSIKVIERIADALQVDPLELFSQVCFTMESVKKLHKSVLNGFDEVVKSHIQVFEAEVHAGYFDETKKL